MIAAVKEVRDRVIADGIAEVEKVYSEHDPRREGALKGFELSRSLEDKDAFETVLAARARREHRLVTERMDGEGDVADYWRHRWATLQIEWVYNCLLVLWGAHSVSGRALRKVADVCAKLEGEAGR